MEAPKNMTLPESHVESKPRETVVIFVSTEEVLVQGERVALVADILGGERAALDPIMARLAQLKENIIGPNTLSVAGSQEVTILADKSVPFAVIKTITPGKLTLLRSQGRGSLTVTLAVRNGGTERTRHTTIEVEEPARDPWLARVPGRDEKPEDDQFYDRDDNNLGVLHYNGILKDGADFVYLKIYAADDLFHYEERPLPKDGTYALSAKLKGGLVKYRVEFGSKTGDRETVLDTVANIRQVLAL